MTSNVQFILDRNESAFWKVRLEDGVSIREADVIDDHGSETERELARAQDEVGDWRLIREDLLARY